MMTTPPLSHLRYPVSSRTLLILDHSQYDLNHSKIKSSHIDYTILYCSMPILTVLYLILRMWYHCHLYYTASSEVILRHVMVCTYLYYV